MQISPLIAVHMSAALGALVLGPEAIWARKGATQRPRLHRAFGYGFATLMLAAAISSAFIGDYGLLNVHGYTPIHLLIPVTLLSSQRFSRAKGANFRADCAASSG